ncbi:MAG: TetR/AcrR family transcriptional regulator, partial [bacterium]|nr:TetR/AcrR family transcriptional regulator [bacterium]
MPHRYRPAALGLDGIEPHRRAPFGHNPQVGERGKATQQAFLHAALETFGETSFHATSVEAIADRVGTSRAAFYQYFDSKDDVFRQLAYRFGAEMSSLLQNLAAIEPNRAGRHLIRGWLTDLAGIYDKYQPIARSWGDAVHRVPRLADASLATSDRFMNEMAEALVVPDDSPVRGVVLADLTWSVAYGACFYRRSHLLVSVDRFADALADAIHRTIFGPMEGVNIGPTVKRTTPRSRGLPGFDQPDLSRLRPKGRRTRERMLKAAAETFERLGYQQTRVADITGRAGLSHGAFYRYFDDKGHAFTELAAAAA